MTSLSTIISYICFLHLANPSCRYCQWCRIFGISSLVYNLVKIKFCHSLFGQSITRPLLKNLLGFQTTTWCTLQIKPSSFLSERQSCNHPMGRLKNTIQFTHCIVHFSQIWKTDMICFLLLKLGTQLQLSGMTKRNHFLRLGLLHLCIRKPMIFCCIFMSTMPFAEAVLEHVCSIWWAWQSLIVHAKIVLVYIGWQMKRRIWYRCHFTPSLDSRNWLILIKLRSLSQDRLHW